jgi:hypothetical protein
MAQAGSWRDLKPGLSDKLLTIIEDKLNFHSMTPVQAATLPKFLQHKDVAVEVRCVSSNFCSGFAGNKCFRDLTMKKWFEIGPYWIW